MPTVAAATEPHPDPRVQAVFDDIRAVRGTANINNFWRYLATDAQLLQDTWNEVKQVMRADSALDGLTKEMIYVAVSVANACGYCVHSHTAAARARGMTDAQYAELLAVVGLAAKTNHLALALQVPTDTAYDGDAHTDLKT